MSDEFNLLICPKCGGFLIRVNEVKEGQIVDCKWSCINPSCRKGLEFDTYYGYTQEDIDNQLDEWLCPACDEWHKKGETCAVWEVRKLRDGIYKDSNLEE